MEEVGANVLSAEKEEERVQTLHHSDPVLFFRGLRFVVSGFNMSASRVFVIRIRSCFLWFRVHGLGPGFEVRSIYFCGTH